MKTPEEMFGHELSAVFVRWWEESDLDELQMSEIGMEVIERFCHSSVDFDSDFNIEESEDDDHVGFEDD